MSNFSCNESNPSEPTSQYLSTWNLCREVLEEQVFTALFENKTFLHQTSSVFPPAMEHSSSVHPGTRQLTDHVLMEQNVCNDNSISTFQTDPLSTCEQFQIVHSPPFEAPLQEPIAPHNYVTNPCVKLCLPQQTVFSEGQQRKAIEFSDLLKLGDTTKNGTSPKYMQAEHGPTNQNEVVSPATLKKKTTSLDKKEMRARRNRESARRSRQKSKQHFQSLERTFVFMNKENKALRLLLQKLLPKCVEKFPYLGAKLHFLLQERL